MIEINAFENNAATIIFQLDSILITTDCTRIGLEALRSPISESLFRALVKSTKRGLRKGVRCRAWVILES